MENFLNDIAILAIGKAKELGIEITYSIRYGERRVR